MKRIALCAVMVIGLAPSITHAQNPNAQVNVFVTTNPIKPVRDIIVKETVQGVTFKGKAKTLAAEEIVDIEYADQMNIQNAIRTYRPAAFAEKKGREAKSADERSKYFNTAIAKYKEVLPVINAKLTNAARHVQYKIGALTSELAFASGDKSQLKSAIVELTKFTSKHTTAWQYTRAMKTLARLHAALDDYDAAQKAVQTLTTAALAVTQKHEATLFLAHLQIDGKKFADARETVKSLIATLPKSNPHRMRARLVDAACLASTGPKLDEAVTKLKAILNETRDKNLRAIAYNTLGECFYRKDLLPQARWQFLWVDVIYNQDKTQHAKALYYLWKTFRRLGEADRAQEFYNTLVNTPIFANSEWKRRAIEEAQKQ